MMVKPQTRPKKKLLVENENIKIISEENIKIVNENFNDSVDYVQSSICIIENFVEVDNEDNATQLKFDMGPIMSCLKN